MKVKFGSIITDGCGKIGGHFVSRNHYGRFLGTINGPTNPQSSYQQAIRAACAQLSEYWRTLTEEQRIAWNVLGSETARTSCDGSNYTLSGFNCFISRNLPLWFLGVPWFTDAPTPDANDEITSLSVTVDSVGQQILFSATSTPTTNDSQVNIYATRPLSQGIFNPTKQYFFIASYDFSIWDFLDYWPDYVARFTAPIPGEKVFFKVVPYSIHDGQSAVPWIVSAIST
jgi:hypothetical protein